MGEEGRAHLVYLLQLWRGEDCVRCTEYALGGWRASLTDPATRECHRFSSLPDLFAYVETVLGAPQNDKQASS